jgi:hypothetical protein
LSIGERIRAEKELHDPQLVELKVQTEKESILGGRAEVGGIIRDVDGKIVPVKVVRQGTAQGVIIEYVLRGFAQALEFITRPHGEKIGEKPNFGS